MNPLHENTISNLKGIASRGIEDLAHPLFIVGPAYSGKSDLAQEYLAADEPCAVIATANADHLDDELKLQLDQVAAKRPKLWQSVAIKEDLATTLEHCAKTYPQILVDSLSQYLAGRLIEGSQKYSTEQLSQHLELERCRLLTFLASTSEKTVKKLVMVSSEVGASVPPPRPLARLYRQLTNQWNRSIAAQAPSVIWMAVGIPTVLKPSTTLRPPL